MVDLLQKKAGPDGKMFLVPPGVSWEKERKEKEHSFSKRPASADVDTPTPFVAQALQLQHMCS